jgi:TolB-like protein/class 3 adenylate cyclase
MARLSAVVSVDAVGSTSAMSSNEMAAMQVLERALDILADEVGSNSGRVLNYSGDGAIAIFDSVSVAVEAALRFQERAQGGDPQAGPPIGFRVGIHLGEVYESGGRAYGDSINVAARVQSATPGGGVCISDLAYRAVHGRADFSFEYLGPHQGKNMTDPVGLYRVHRGAVALLKASPRPERRSAPQHDHAADVPSIAVLPFRNLSAGEVQDYLADGVTDDIITSLSRFRGIDLIARSSSFALRGREMSVSEIGRRLRARYVAQGSIRHAGNRVRISIELSNAENEHTIWAEKYDRPLEDIFALQDEIAELAVSVMSVRIDDAEQKRVTSAPPESLRAYGLALKGQSHLLNLTAPDNAIARQSYERSILASPRYARAFAGLSRCHSLDWRYSWGTDPANGLQRAFDIAVQAVTADPNDARGHAELGYALLYRREHDRSLASYRRALALNPNDATIIAEMADSLTHSGQSQEALALFDRAMRLNPFYPDQYLWDMAGAFMKLHRFEEAIESVRRMNNVTQGRRILAVCYAHLGRLDEAKREAELVRSAQPDFTAEHWVEVVPDRRAEDRQTLLSGLKAAGL